jgi:hypothetical protein
LSRFQNTKPEKMKVIVLVGFLLIGLAYCIPVDENKLQKLDNSSEEDLESTIKEIQDYVDKKCDTGKGEKKDIKVILSAITDCLDDHVPNTPEEIKDLGKADSSDQICDSPGKIHKIRECFQPAINVLKDCSDDEEKYLPEFIFDAVENVYNFVCADDGKNIEKVFQNSTLECLEILGSDDKALEVCEDKKDSFGLSADDTILTKTELCSGVGEAKSCYVDFITKKCPNDSNVKELFSGLVDAISGPCSK